MPALSNRFEKSDFGKEFIWGAASSAFQTEGAWNIDGKSPSIWDTFSSNSKRTRQKGHAKQATNFYNRFPYDLDLLKEMNFSAFRFSLSWPRLLPNGTGNINKKGIDFYNKLIDTCLSLQITPWITLYHWDLPQCLENCGGWTNRDIVNWFTEYVSFCSRYFGDRVKHWMVLNDPLTFSALGYLLGKHAPGRKGLDNFLPAVHHAALCQSVGSQVIKDNVLNAMVGTTYSCSVVEPFRNIEKDCIAATKLDAGINRLLLEPALGLGYPLNDLPELKRIEDFFAHNDENRLPGKFDFIGLQYYFRVVVKQSLLSPFHIGEVKAVKRRVPVSSEGYEIYPQGLYRMIKKFNAYKDIKKFIISESGVCVPDKPVDSSRIMDTIRIYHHAKSLETILNCRREGIPVEGFFARSLTDNYEWTGGYSHRFGLVYVDNISQKRIIKDSGKWFQELLSKQVY